MVKEEKINIRVAHKRVKENLSELKKSNFSIEDIFNITFIHPNYTFLNIITDSGMDEISYKTAKRDIEILGTAFNNKINNQSKYVGILLPNSKEWIYSFYGLLMFGYIPVLLSNRNSHISNEEVINSLGIKYIISNENTFNNVISINPYKLGLKDAIINNSKKWANEVVFLTSGTSDKCKIISYTGKELSNQIFNGAELLKKNPMLASNYKGYLKHLLVLPLFHIFGFIAVFLWFSFFNVTFVIPYNLSKERIQQAALIAKPTHIFAVPLFFDTLVNSIEAFVKSRDIEKKFNKGIEFSIKLQKINSKLGLNIVRKKIFGKYLNNILGDSIKCCISGGSFIQDKTLKVINGIGYPLSNGYGSTEIGISSFTKLKKIKDRLKPSIGNPFPSYTYKLKETNNGLFELYVNGLSTYNKAFINCNWVNKNNEDFIATNDCAIYKGNQYYLLGRLDEMIIGPNGENVSLAMLEKSLTIPHASDYVLIRENNKLILLISFSKNTLDVVKNIDLAKLFKSIEFRRNNINKVFITNLEFPRANEIKIRRFKVVELFKDSINEFKECDINNFDFDNEKTVFNDNVLNQVIGVFQSLFPNKEIKNSSDFFSELGGDSLLYFSLLEKMNQTFNIIINSETDILKTPIDFTNYIMKALNL